MSDTEISKMQSLLGYNLSLSDYANRKYIPADVKVPSELQRILSLFRGLSMGASDVSIALKISELAVGRSQRVSILPARSMQLKDFKTDDNFVLLGSPRSDPWVGLLQDQLDFELSFDPALQNEVIRNKKPKSGEPSRYVPSARGFGTGQAFGIIAFLANPNQSGHILLLAGSNAEATEAAGKLVTNQDQFSRILKANGIDPEGSARPFEALLRVNTMAGSANTFDVIAFHPL